MRWVKNNIAVIFIFIAVVCICGITLYEFKNIKIQTSVAMEKLGVIEEMTEKINSGVSYSDKRKKIVLSLYNRIIESNPKLPKDLAYKIADYDFYISAEIYKSFDPFLLLAIQWKETGGSFNPKIKNETSGATGLNQLMPTTAKWIAKGMRWEWNNSYLIDPFRNTDLAAAYLDFLFADLEKTEYVLSWYNGGFRQYVNFKTGGADALCKETKDYLSSIMAYRDEIKLMENIKEFEFPSVTDSVRPENKKPLKKVKIVIDTLLKTS